MSAAQLTGRCNCGAVTFVANGPFRPAKACHCKSCRRQSGHYLAATEVDRAALTVSGEEMLTWFAASDHARRGFCRVCGAHLFWERYSSGRISILMGCLDEPTGLHLADHIYVGEKGDYYEIADGLPQALEHDRMAR
ncbi:MAG: GFA family protein [Propylenella sp.]